MPEKEKFYQVMDGFDDLKPGNKIVINHSLRIWYGDADLSALISHPPKEVLAMQKDSMKREAQIYEKLRKAVAEWEEQGAQTLLMEKALEYLNTPEVEHTSNQWRENKDKSWEISNRVYRMHYQISKEGDTSVWRVTWVLEYNVPRQPVNDDIFSYQFTGDSIRIAGQNRKPYNAMADALNYIQGRFDLYTHLFTEISPLVPDKCKRMFSVNGHLLPGYTLAPPERTSKEAMEELLSFLEDDEVSDTPPEQAATPPIPQEKKSIQPAPRAAHAKKTGTGKKSRPAVAR